MNKKFRILAATLSLSLCVGLLAACSSNNGGNTGSNTTGNNTTSDNSSSTGGTEESNISINTVGEVTAINDDGSLELKIYSGSGNIADFAAVDLSAYTATEEAESITISDESVLFTAENGSLVSSKADAIAVGDMLVLSQDIDTDALTQVVVYPASAEDSTGDAADASGADASANSGSDANSADTGDAGSSANAAE